MHYMYVLQSEIDKERFYIGCTSNLKRRFAEHNAGQVETTRDSKWRLVYYEAFLTLSSARKREYRLKASRNAKAQLMRRILESLK